MGNATSKGGSVVKALRALRPRGQATTINGERVQRLSPAVWGVGSGLAFDSLNLVEAILRLRGTVQA